MNKYAELKPGRLKRETGQMDLQEALAWARRHIDPETGWLLAESPEKVIWSRLAEIANAASLGNCLNLTIFDAKSEIRLRRHYGAPRGDARMISEADDGIAGLERVTSYLLRENQGRLEYGEFFVRDSETGMLNLEFARYRGVRRA